MPPEGSKLTHPSTRSNHQYIVGLGGLARLHPGTRGMINPLRAAAVIAVLAGAAGSFVLMLLAGRHQNSLILLALFAIWVLSPFVALVIADRVSKHWSDLTRMTLDIVMLVLPLGSLAIYGKVALGPPRAQPAFFFLVVPLASWLLIAIVVPMAAVISRRQSHRGG